MPWKQWIDNRNLIFLSCPKSTEAYDAQPIIARVVKWQTRTFEGRMPKGMGVQVPPRAPFSYL